MTSNPAAVILVADKLGYKYDSVVKHLVKRFFRTPQSTVRILRGELLKEYHHDDKRYNYVLQKDPSVFLTCADEDVAPLFTNKEFMLMEGIEKQVDRFSAYCNGMIDLGMSLEHGSRVFVNENYGTEQLIRATVHYIGEVQGYQGFQFGVELTHKIEGGHNGTVSGHVYFQCEDGHGKFVPLNRLVKYSEERYSKQSSASSQEPGETPSLRSKGDSRHNDGPSKSIHSESNLESHLSSSKCKVGDRVCFYSIDDQLSEGTVKWLGTLNLTKLVGILTDNDVYTTDYENSAPGLDHLIDAPTAKCLFIPESMVNKIEPKKSERLKEISIATKPAEEMDCQKHGVLDEQQKVQQQKELEEEFKRAGVPHDELKGQVEQLKQLQQKHLQSKENEVTEVYLPGENIAIGSMVQLPNPGSGGGIYGIVRWIGTMHKVTGKVAGIELEEYMEGCTNGSWDGENKKIYKFFSCEDGKGLYYPLNRLILDARVSRLGINRDNPLADTPEMDRFDQHRVTVNTNNLAHYVGEKKGIQGHQNSCYLDATVFGLFSLSHEFDEMFLRDRDSRVGQILWQKIVNPLRMFGVVKYEAVMELLMEMDKLRKMKGITHAQKDPEEFLNFMFKNSMKVKPFVKIRRPFGIESEYLVQLFIELNEPIKPRYIGTLLSDLFKEKGISFTQVPSKLLIHVPPHEKKIQSFQKIIPELIISISEVTDSTSKGECFLCGNHKATVLCKNCHEEFGTKNRMGFCDSCFNTTHTHLRKDHYNEQIGIDADLELLSVLCIENSHYVCFTRNDNQWLFFDSMFDRKYDRYYIPRVQDVSRELNDWVYPRDRNISRLLQTNPRDLPDSVRCITQDIYLCVYIQRDMSMY